MADENIDSFDNHTNYLMGRLEGMAYSMMHEMHKTGMFIQGYNETDWDMTFNQMKDQFMSNIQAMEDIFSLNLNRTNQEFRSFSLSRLDVLQQGMLNF